MENNIRRERLNHVIELNNAKKFDEAEKLVDELIENIEIVEIDKYGKVLDFSSEIEFVLYCQSQEKDSNVSWNRNYNTDIYLNKAIILYEREKNNEAIIFLKKALRWNPLRVQVYSEMLENYIKLKDYNNFKECFKEAVEIATKPIELAILYRKYAVVCVDMGDYETAYNLLLYSKLFFPREEADFEIKYIAAKIGSALPLFPDVGTINYIISKGLNYVANKNVIIAYISLIKSYTRELEKNTNEKLYMHLIQYHEALYFFEKNEDTHKMLVNIKREYEEYRKSSNENNII